MNRRSLRRHRVSAPILTALFVTVAAAEPPRVWVDVSGYHSVRATLIDVDETHIRLRPTDGGDPLKLRRDQLSEADRRYLEDLPGDGIDPDGERTDRPVINPMRIAPPPPREFPVLPPLRFRADDTPTGPPAAMIGDVAAATVPPIASTDREPIRLPADPPVRRSVTQGGVPDVVLIRDAPPTDLLGGLRDANGRLVLSFADRVTGGSRTVTIDRRGMADVVQTSGDPLRLLDAVADVNASDGVVAPPPGLLLAHAASSVGYGEGGLVTLFTDSDSRVVVRHRIGLPDGTRLIDGTFLTADDVVMFGRSVVAVTNTIDGRVRYRLPVVRGYRHDVSPGRHYVALTDRATLRIVRTVDGREMVRIGIPNGKAGVAFSPDGDRLAVTVGRRWMVYDLITGRFVHNRRTTRTLGSDRPFWLDDDRFLTANGVLISTVADAAIARYADDGIERRRVGGDLYVVADAGGATRLRRMSADDFIRPPASPGSRGDSKAADPRDPNPQAADPKRLDRSIPIGPNGPPPIADPTADPPTTAANDGSSDLQRGASGSPPSPNRTGSPRRRPSTAGRSNAASVR